jgi:hypothetical protein
MNVGEFAFSEEPTEAEPAKDYATFHCTLEVQCCAPFGVHSSSFVADHLWYQKVFKIIKATVWIAYFLLPQSLYYRYNKKKNKINRATLIYDM